MAKQRATQSEQDRLWEAYFRSRSDVDRNAILTSYWPWIVCTVRTYLERRHCADLIGTLLSYVGERLLKTAIPNYDPSRGATFKTYARPHIFGGMSDGMRIESPTSRLIHGRLRTLSELYSQLGHALGRRPTDAEFAEAAGIAETDVISLFEPNTAQLTGEGDCQTLDPPQDQVDEFDILTRGLTERSQLALRLYYFWGHTMKEIGAFLGLSESRMSQIIAADLRFLREHRQPSEFLPDKILCERTPRFAEIGHRAHERSDREKAS